MPPAQDNPQSRRQFLRSTARAAGLTSVGMLVGAAASRLTAETTVWQIDPAKCLRCGLCATACVLEQSAVKCVHSFALCGYCELCTGYFIPEPNALNTAAENQLCPTAALQRHYVEDPYYAYTIDENLCIGCAKCVDGCARFGNGSLYLQIRHDRCLNCNECSIARVCAGNAFRRVPASHPYLLKQTH
ncbi:MAG TPA: 4Fe-4S binding protein [Verrucomicrobiota bacterium]|nr:4Fe-4S binding protein [Verrucomicrobiota bacterium]HNU50412.1 4Fe-4S binding protein [Verrucomicrobiota bacterium]